jgi:DNA-binding Lrp family transcriptional regulator
MMKTDSLSEKEKKVLVHITRYPSVPHSKICDILGMKKSTFSHVKNSLAARGYYHPIRIPLFRCIGCELLMISYGALDRTTSIESRMTVAKDLFSEFSEFFYIISESNQAVNFAVSQNYTEYDKDVQRFNQLYTEKGFLDDKGFKYVAFPFETSNIISFFNYAPYLSRHLEVDMDKIDYDERIDTCNTCPPQEVVVGDMSFIERKIFYGLIAYPELSDSNLAEQIGASRNTIAKLKGRFIREGLILTKMIPDLGMLGARLMNFTHISFHPRIDSKRKKMAADLAQKILTPVLFVHKSLEGVMLVPFSDYEDFQVRYGKLMRTYLDRNIILEEPKNLLLSIPQMVTIKNHVYAPLVRKVLRLDELAVQSKKGAYSMIRS